MFLDGTTVPQTTWVVVGAGIRAALEVGVHRKKMYALTPNVEEELWRRAFWYVTRPALSNRCNCDIRVL